MCGDPSVMQQRQPPMPRPQPNGPSIGGALQDSQFWRDIGGNTSRVAQGMTAGALGAPVDLMSAAVRPFAQMMGKSMPPESVVGSSDWIGQKSGHDTQSIPWLAGSIGPIPDATDAARMATLADKFGPMAMAGMTAWHGSPHKIAPEPDAPFGRFRPEAGRTGTGIQQQGAGAYLSSEKPIAQGYANMPVGSEFYHPDLSPGANAQLRGFLWDSDFESPAEVTSEWLRAVARSTADGGDPTIAAEIARADPSKLTFSNKGSVYQVDLPDEYLPRMLDWEKPISEQTPEVQAAIARMDVPMSDIQNLRGQDLYEELQRMTGGDPEDISEWMRSAGIVGTTYEAPEAMAGRNFVIFDYDIAKIIGVE